MKAIRDQWKLVMCALLNENRSLLSMNIKINELKINESLT